MASAVVSRRFGSVRIPSSAPAKTEGIWKFLLDGAARTAEFEKSTFLLLGKRDAGKAHLVRALQKIGAGGRKMNDMEMFGEAGGVAGLDYAYMNVRAVDDADLTESLTTADVWILQDIHHKDFLSELVTPAHLGNLLVMICLDLSEPWTLRAELKAWFTFANEFIEDLRSKLSVEEQEAFRTKLSRYVNTYRKKVEGIPIDLEEQNQSSLVVNLGVPFVVCVCKSDSAVSLDTRACPGRADAVLAHLRHLCLPYGAALIYCCTKDPMSSANLERIYRYCLHRTYDFPFLEPPIWAPSTSIFIPSGWDTAEEITAFASKTVGGGLQTPLETLLPAPPEQAVTPAQDSSSELAVPSMDHFLEGLVASDPSLLVKPPTTRVPPAVERQTSGGGTVRKPSRAEPQETGRVPSSRRHAEGAKGDAESLRAFFQTLLTKPPASARPTSPREGKRSKDEAKKVKRISSKVDSPGDDSSGTKRKDKTLMHAVTESDGKGTPTPVIAGSPEPVVDMPLERARGNSGAQVGKSHSHSIEPPSVGPPQSKQLESTTTSMPRQTSVKTTRPAVERSLAKTEVPARSSHSKLPTVTSQGVRQSSALGSQVLRQSRDRSSEKLQTRSSVPHDATLPRRTMEEGAPLRKSLSKLRPSEP